MNIMPENSRPVHFFDPSGFINELREELGRIMDFWSTRMRDHSRGGFYGEMGGNNRLKKDAPRGLILNARILWTCSSVSIFTGNEKYRKTAMEAFEYFMQHFIDRKNGGVFWSVSPEGNPLNRRKQIYAVAFAIYALAEFHKLSRDQTALKSAIDLYRLIERYAFDKIHGGYLEAFSETWEYLEDVRLSEKETNDRKTMNTHLHILEAYTNLCRVWPDTGLLKQLKNLVMVFRDRIIDPVSFHQRLFFKEDWTVTSRKISYGHDIEASWLLHEAAVTAGNQELLASIVPVSTGMAEATLEGMDSGYGLMNEYDPAGGHLDSDRHWWVQAEAMVGFVNAFQLTGKKEFLDLASGIWGYVKKYILDKEQGEWFWRVTREGQTVYDEVKAGFWKCPYHNSRMCMEVIRRMASGVPKRV